MHIALVSEHARIDDHDSSPLDELVGPEVEALASALVRLGARVDVLARRQHPRSEEETVAAAGYRVISVDAGPAMPIAGEQLIASIGQFGSALRDCWARERPDIVHAHSWVSGLASVLAAREVQSPTAVSFHGLVDKTEPAPSTTSIVPRAALERKISRSADRVIASSTTECEELTRLGVARSRVSIIPSGVNGEVFFPRTSPADNGRDRRRVAMDGADSGVQTVIELLEKIPDAELLIVGDCPEVRRLRTVSAARRVARRVMFTGPILRADRPAVLQTVDLFVCMSSTESAGTAAMEAMACAVPVAAYGVGWMADLVVDEVTGRLIDPPSRRELARAIEVLLGDDLQLFAQGVSAADRIQSRYSWNRIAGDLTRVYEETVRAHFDRLHPRIPIPEARRYAV